MEEDRKNASFGYDLENCVVACAVCEIAKSAKFSYDEFKRMGAAIKKIWQNSRKTKIRHN